MASASIETFWAPQVQQPNNLTAQPGSLTGSIQTVSNVGSSKTGDSFSDTVYNFGKALISPGMVLLNAGAPELKKAIPDTFDIKFILVAGAIVLVLVLVIVKQFI